MDIQSLKKIINISITSMLRDIENQDLSYNISILKKAINESIVEYTTGCVSKSAEVSAMFSGRGRAWAKVSNGNHLFESIIDKLKTENSLEKDTTNLIDLFETNKLAWMRFSRANKERVTFSLRYNGSKSEECILFFVKYSDINLLENLEGVPHHLGLEEGMFNAIEVSVKKDVLEEDIDSSELNLFGIQTLEDILNAEN
jgi:hypothetical protein